MKHAGAEALDALEPLLLRLRGESRLKERKRGLFYYRSRSFLHFHEDPAGLFADVCIRERSWRLRVNDPAEQKALLDLVEEALGDERRAGVAR